MEDGRVVAQLTSRDVVNYLRFVFHKNAASDVTNNHVSVNSVFLPVRIEGSNYSGILSTFH